jgi:hypothetical protein
VSTVRGTHRYDRVTVTLVPQTDEKHVLQIPTTFDSANRTYGWERSGGVEYMIVPTRITNTEVKVDIFLNPQKRGKLPVKDVGRVAENLVKGKIATQWKGLRLGGISKPMAAQPPQKIIRRGTIEEILGSTFEQ